MADSVLPFDDRDGFIWLDGRLVPWRDAKLHVLTHGLHYASCVFEGERVYNGKVFRMEDHNERLINSARILGFEVPASMDLVRLAIPRRTYTQSHIDYVIEVCEEVAARAAGLPGYRSVVEPKTLRHFTSSFEQLG